MKKPFFFLQTYLNIEQNKTKIIQNNYYNELKLPLCGTLNTGLVFSFIIDDELVGGTIILENSEVNNC